MFLDQLGCKGQKILKGNFEIWQVFDRVVVTHIRERVAVYAQYHIT